MWEESREWRVVCIACRRLDTLYMERKKKKILILLAQDRTQVLMITACPVHCHCHARNACSKAHSSRLTAVPFLARSATSIIFFSQPHCRRRRYHSLPLPSHTPRRSDLTLRRCRRRRSPCPCRLDLSLQIHSRGTTRRGTLKRPCNRPRHPCPRKPYPHPRRGALHRLDRGDGRVQRTMPPFPLSAIHRLATSISLHPRTATIIIIIRQKRRRIKHHTPTLPLTLLRTDSEGQREGQDARGCGVEADAALEDVGS